MIDFSKITKTLDGFDCHYFGTRISNGIKLHCFGVWTTTGLYEKCYDENGKHLVWSDLVGKWCVSNRPDFQIVKPPKIIEVTRWVGYYWDKDKGDVCTDFYVQVYPDAERAYLKLSKITESIEVPNE